MPNALSQEVKKFGARKQGSQLKLKAISREESEKLKNCDEVIYSFKNKNWSTDCSLNGMDKDNVLISRVGKLDFKSGGLAQLGN